MTLDHFYLDMDLWLKGEWPYEEEDCPFYEKQGVCANLQKWCRANGAPYGELSAGLAAEFKDAGLHSIWPFGHFFNGTGDLYTGARLNWIGLRAHRAIEGRVKRALQALLTWVEGGCPDHELFSRHNAICHTTRFWFRHHRYPYWSVRYWPVLVYFKDLFDAEGLNREVPFNNGSLKQFRAELDKGTVYQNPKRLAWLRSHT